jgi:hypothetical protein
MVAMAKIGRGEHRWRRGGDLLRVTLAVTAMSVSARQQQRPELLLEQPGRERGSVTVSEWGSCKGRRWRSVGFYRQRGRGSEADGADGQWRGEGRRQPLGPW